MITIVSTHPWHGSFNHAILDTITRKLDEEGLDYKVIDLTSDGFNPVMTAKDLSLYSKGESDDRLVKKYRHILQHTDEIIFLFPIWWGSIPAILKGFFDKVLLKGSAFTYSSTGELIPLLKISRTLLISTSQGETAIYRPYIEGYLIPYLLNSVGMTGAEWYNCERTSHGPAENRENFLRQISSLI